MRRTYDPARLACLLLKRRVIHVESPMVKNEILHPVSALMSTMTGAV